MLSPAGSRLIEDARNHAFETVVIKQTDRLGRDTIVNLVAVAQLQTLGIAIQAVHGTIDAATPEGQLTLTLESAIAQFGRQDLIRRSI